MEEIISIIIKYKMEKTVIHFKEYAKQIISKGLARLNTQDENVQTQKPGLQAQGKEN
jgi:pyrimidine deaminase RibD-like protein